MASILSATAPLNVVCGLGERYSSKKYPAEATTPAKINKQKGNKNGLLAKFIVAAKKSNITTEAIWEPETKFAARSASRLFFTACWTTTDGTGMTHSAANVPRAMGNPLGMKTDTTAAHAKPVAYFAAKNPMQSLVCCLLNPASNNTPTVIKTNGLFAFANGSANLCTTVGKLCPMILETKTTANAIKGGNFNMFKAFFFKVSSFNDSTFILAASARNVASLTVAVNSSMGTIFSNSFAFQMPALTTPLRSLRTPKPENSPDLKFPTYDPPLAYLYTPNPFLTFCCHSPS